MSAEKEGKVSVSKLAGLFALGASVIPGAAFATSGDSPRQSIFGAEDQSSPYAFNEKTP
jgi:hypothetical protein